MTNKTKQQIRLNKVYQRLNKPRYTTISKIDAQFIKLHIQRDQLEKDLYGMRGFYALCKRNKSGAVDWNNLSVAEVDLFTDVQSRFDNVNKKISKFIDKYGLDEKMQHQIFASFKQSNSLSVCY